MAAPTLKNSNSGNSGGAASTSLAASMPASLVSPGDTLILLVAHKDVTSGQVTMPAPWTKFFETINTGGSAASLTGFWKLADGTEDGTSVTVSFASSTRNAYVSLCIGGAADPTVSHPEATVGTTNNTNAPDPPVLSPSAGAGDYLFLAAFASSHGRITSAVPTGYGDSVTSGDNGGSATHVGIGVADKATTGASSEDPGAFTTTGTGVEETAYATIAVYPAPAGGGSPQTATPSGLASEGALGAVTIHAAIIEAVSGLASEAAFGAVTLTPGPVSKTVSGVASEAAFGTITIVPGGTHVSVAGLASEAALGAVGIHAAVVVPITGLTSEAAFGSITLLTGNVVVPVSGLASEAALGIVTLPSGGQFVSPLGLASEAAFGALTAHPGNVAVPVSGLGSEAVFGAVTIGVGGTRVSLPGLGTQALFGPPFLVGGMQLITFGSTRHARYGRGRRIR